MYDIIKRDRHDGSPFLHASSACVVYWLYDDQCICPWRHGYVGISERWSKRLRRHKHGKRWPANFKAQILFAGSVLDCLKLERAMRPMPGIGWNEAPGGEKGGGKALKKARTRLLMSEAALRRYQDPAERERTRQSVIGTKDHRGEKNPRFGKTQSETTKQKIRDKIIERGGIAGENNPMFGKKRPDLAERNRLRARR